MVPGSRRTPSASCQHAQVLLSSVEVAMEYLMGLTTSPYVEWLQARGRRARVLCVERAWPCHVGMAGMRGGSCGAWHAHARLVRIWQRPPRNTPPRRALRAACRAHTTGG
jgi:hypothetical protein